MAIEDYRFKDHIGIDPYRIIGAVFKNITTSDTQALQQLRSSLLKIFFSTRTRPIQEK
jgi:penicillin-binding protein 1A